MSFGDVDVVNTLAVEAKIDSMLIRLLTQMASKRLLASMGTKVCLKMVCLGIPTATSATLERFFPSVGTNVNYQAFLEGKCLFASGAHMGTVSAMDAPMLGEHGLGEKTGSTLADEGTVACMKACVQC